MSSAISCFPRPASGITDRGRHRPDGLIQGRESPARHRLPCPRGNACETLSTVFSTEKMLCVCRFRERTTVPFQAQVVEKICTACKAMHQLHMCNAQSDIVLSRPRAHIQVISETHSSSHWRLRVFPSGGLSNWQLHYWPDFIRPFFLPAVGNEPPGGLGRTRKTRRGDRAGCPSGVMPLLRLPRRDREWLQARRRRRGRSIRPCDRNRPHRRRHRLSATAVR